MSTETIALKEWAAAIKALEDGTQILIMRKGGIVEETKAFTLKSRSFYLYPTYEHQQKVLLQDKYHPYLEETLKGWTPDDRTVTITSRAEVEEDLEVFEAEELEKLKGFHIGTDRFAEERLKWKRKNPLHLLLLRVYKLDEPLEIPVKPEYNGCRSWIGLDVELSGRAEKPVLDEEAFRKRMAEIRRAIGR
ncbi:DUF1802 family protein [Paenibacillus aurantius]|uniref:DUF1802 family protein n=1 Tax=Paenibacillus aurantius TaxID=2918900 RepID=A0AA96LAE1_9BACL|nr:DUF1802 family protein [Paenibacillus aurantius]WNQ09996.1 DUF1802 family protein [Paenibacillus aurantius]